MVGRSRWPHVGQEPVPPRSNERWHLQRVLRVPSNNSDAWRELPPEIPPDADTRYKFGRRRRRRKATDRWEIARNASEVQMLACMDFISSRARRCAYISPMSAPATSLLLFNKPFQVLT